ncbi:hypothetical protein JCGZ_06757 [Jatropha curcas]|uniref:Carbonic anhydrase n=1 Tax=Jatropha curcas TaxID=180498 RepID=A0A067KQQ3_JATCU|nr:alpha carbonic anhydrase 1, chloroplastic [Jatropha curcas]KDP37303.1 hypothetical protein JCGZ_06757 [Jatropha curcas]
MAAQVSFSSLILALFFLNVNGEGPVAAIFGYSATNGPEKWGSLRPTYSQCSKGKSQSPINIIKNDSVADGDLKPLIRDYKAANAVLVNNVYNVGINFERSGAAGQLSLDGKNYQLANMHWHSPSEHQINEFSYPLELHLVHQAADGALSVVAILYEDGPEDPFTAKIQDGLTKLAQAGNSSKGVPIGLLDIEPLKEKASEYFTYTGSLTTPPCSENVLWNVLAKVATVSKAQVEALKAPLGEAYKQNSRPIQPLNDRKVSLYKQV